MREKSLSTEVAFKIQTICWHLHGYLWMGVLVNQVVKLVTDAEPKHAHHVVQLHMWFRNIARLQPLMNKEQLVHRKELQCFRIKYKPESFTHLVHPSTNW